MNKEERQIVIHWAKQKGYDLFKENILKALEDVKINDLKNINLIKVQQNDADETYRLVKTQSFLDALYSITALIEKEGNKELK